MKRIWATYVCGIAAGSAAGFFSPLWFLGFIPISLGFLYAAYDLVEVADGDASSTPQR